MGESAFDYWINGHTPSLSYYLVVGLALVAAIVVLKFLKN